MANFCDKCLKEYMGITKKDVDYKFWLVEDGGICEGCGYDYLKDGTEVKT